MHWLPRSLAFLFFALTAYPAAAWNDCGHMVVAAIAYQQLEPATRTKVSELLRLNPRYEDWTTAISAADQDEVAFLRAATWADYIKRDPDYVNDGDTAAAAGPDAVRNIGYEDRTQHRYWHYVDTAFSPDGTALPKTPKPNVTTQIAAFRKVLASPAASPELKSYDLVWLLHLVGDLHQPLHATSRYTKQLPRGDRGGNSVALCKSPCKDDLHGFWDGAIGKCFSPFAARSMARGFPPAPAAAGEVSKETQWQNESRELARTMAYRSPVGLDEGPVSLDDAYRRDAKQVARERVALAGARLAKLLNAELR
jgi:hypothetical protein